MGEERPFTAIRNAQQWFPPSSVAPFVACPAQEEVEEEEEESDVKHRSEMTKGKKKKENMGRQSKWMCF